MEAILKHITHGINSVTLRKIKTMNDERFRLLRKWAEDYSQEKFKNFERLHEQASFRRYFRAGNAIWVDAPTTHEDTETFVKIAQLLAHHGVRVPRIYTSDLDQGFLCLEDFGSRPLYQLIDANNANQLYRQAMETLVQIARVPLTTPVYDAQMVQGENELFKQWFLQNHLGLKLSAREEMMLDTVFQALIQNHLQQPQCCVHRDYHSLNLMVLDDLQIGVLDFQDLVVGPVTYDLISLLEDCYLSWPAWRVTQWLTQGYHLFEQHQLTGSLTEKDFIISAQLCGLQRHLKAIGIFSRLHHRDGKSAYLTWIPLILDYVFRACFSDPAFSHFGRWLTRKVQPLLDQVCKSCY